MLLSENMKGKPYNIDISEEAENDFDLPISIMMYLDNYILTIKDLCRQNNVKSLYVFGSVLSDRFNEGSDIDLIVEINSDDPIDYAERYFNLKFGLQELFKRPVDLLESKAILNPFILENIDNSKFLIYAFPANYRCSSFSTIFFNSSICFCCFSMISCCSWTAFTRGTTKSAYLRL